MTTSLVTVLGFLLGNTTWSQLGDRCSYLFPLIVQSFSPPNRCGWPRDPEKVKREHQARLELGVYHVSSIPVYLRHLDRHPDSLHLIKIFRIFETIDLHQALFLPYAVANLKDAPVRPEALKFLAKHGGAPEAQAVAALLIDPAFWDVRPHDVFACLRKIGGRKELPLVTQFIVNRIARDPDQLWLEEAEECRTAIQKRVDSEEKSLRTHKDAVGK